VKKLLLLVVAVMTANGIAAPNINTVRLDDKVRAEQVKKLNYGMFICWSMSTFDGPEDWCRGTKEYGADFFNPSGCDTDQWAKVASEAGMTHILFLTKHHDGFCLWDTDTTDFKVTRSPLGMDVLEAVRKSCDKYGLKLALYYSDDEFEPQPASVKKAQLKELLTRYGDIEFIWFDGAVGLGGVDYNETYKLVKQLQPNCYPCMPGGTGDLLKGEMKNAAFPFKLTGRNKAFEFTYPTLSWFYQKPDWDNVCIHPEQVAIDYFGAVERKCVFDLAIAPMPNGKLRSVDIAFLKKVKEYIDGSLPRPQGPIESWTRTATYNNPKTLDAEKHPVSNAFDGNPETFWQSANASHYQRENLEVDLKSVKKIGAFKIHQAGTDRIVRCELQYRLTDKDPWHTFKRAERLNERTYHVKPFEARYVRLVIRKINQCNGPAIISEFELYPPLLDLQ